MNNTKNYLFAGMLCLSIYWLSNSVLWIPWKYAAWLGAICMLVYVPIAWGGISYVSLRKFEARYRMKAKYKMGLLFAVVAFFSDVCFYVGYRKIPDELFKPATFGAYVLCFVAPILCGSIMQKKNIESKQIRTQEWVAAGLAVIAFVSTTFYVVQFW